MKLDAWLADAIARHGVPGASVAVSLGERIESAVAGVTSTALATPVRPDTLFLVGSVSKLYTATIAMRLIDAGVLSASTRVADVLPELGWDADEQRRTIAVEHLLTHTSGISGDDFRDYGRGDDCLERFAAGAAQLPLLHDPGEQFSYCNAGMMLLGRVLERVGGGTYDELLLRHVVEPLALQRTLTLPEQMLLHSVAIGHRTAPGGAQVPSRHWSYTRAVTPSGGIAATALDVLAFALGHLPRADGASTLLGAEAAAEMRARRLAVDVPPIVARSLGWMHYDWADGELIGHDGDALGQQACLRLAVDGRFAAVVLVNRPAGEELLGELLGLLADEHGWAAPRVAPAELDGAVAPIPPAWSGRYRRAQCSLVVDASADPATLVLEYEPPWTEYREEAQVELTLSEVDEQGRCLALDGKDAIGGARFLGTHPDDDGRPLWVRLGARLYLAEDRFEFAAASR